MKPDPLAKYLRRNTPSHSPMPFTLAEKPRFAVVIPACDELHTLPDTLASLASNPPQILAAACVIIVVNNPPDTPNAVRQANLKLLELLKHHPFPLELIIFDAASQGQEISNGVGQARKIGMDFAIGILDSNASPLIFCLDADTLVEPNYLQAASDAFSANPRAAGAVFDFIHRQADDPAVEQAIRAYEHYMREYVDGLARAGSPYAYHSLGSAIVCRASSYIACGGMKARQAGEDFYFLQALRKNGDIISINSSRVMPSPRPSARVPFGTGPRVSRIIQGETLPAWPPAPVERLAELLNAANNCQCAQLPSLHLLFEETLPQSTLDFLHKHSFHSAWPRITANLPNTRNQLLHAFHTWFDAFRTLKFIHHHQNLNTKAL